MPLQRQTRCLRSGAAGGVGREASVPKIFRRLQPSAHSPLRNSRWIIRLGALAASEWHGHRMVRKLLPWFGHRLLWPSGTLNVPANIIGDIPGGINPPARWVLTSLSSNASAPRTIASCGALGLTTGGTACTAGILSASRTQKAGGTPALPTPPTRPDRSHQRPSRIHCKGLHPRSHRLLRSALIVQVMGKPWIPENLTVRLGRSILKITKFVA